MAQKKKSKTNRNKRKLKVPNFGEALRNPTYHLVLGLFLISFALYLVGAFFSYLFYWAEDQSLVGQTYSEVLARPEVQARNALGKLGAGLAHQFIHLWFGLAAFLVPWLLILTGLRLSLKVSLSPIRRSLASVLFLLIWIPAFMAFLSPTDRKSVV